jgi:protein gp37
VEDQKAADERIPHLLRTPAAVRWLSCEPLLGAIGLMAHIGKDYPYLDWVVCGGESGPEARPMHPDWARSLRDQCSSAGVPFFFKQFGEWAPAGPAYDTVHCLLVNRRTGLARYLAEGWGLWSDAADWECVRKFGKKAAGRVLDGRTWDEFPEVEASRNGAKAQRTAGAK